MSTRKRLQEISGSGADESGGEALVPRLALDWVNADSAEARAAVIEGVSGLSPSELIYLGFTFSRLRGGPSMLGELCDELDSGKPTAPEEPHPGRSSHAGLATTPPPASDFR